MAFFLTGFFHKPRGVGGQAGRELDKVTGLGIVGRQWLELIRNPDKNIDPDTQVGGRSRIDRQFLQNIVGDLC